MDKLIIEAENLLPEINLDPQTGKLVFSGKSSPDDVHEFYTPVLNWLKEYALNPAEKTVMEFYMYYFNTASAKMIFTVMKTLIPLSEVGKHVKIVWKYQEDDEDLLEAGKDYSLIVDVPFEFVAIKI